MFFVLDTETDVPIIMAQRLLARANMAWAEEFNDSELVERYRKEDVSLGKLARSILRKEGFAANCEIDPRMEELAQELFQAWEKANWYIKMNSPRFARASLALGITSIRDWQDRHPTPIRPDKRH